MVIKKVGGSIQGCCSLDSVSFGRTLNPAHWSVNLRQKAQKKCLYEWMNETSGRKVLNKNRPFTLCFSKQGFF